MFIDLFFIVSEHQYLHFTLHVQKNLKKQLTWYI